MVTTNGNLDNKRSSNFKEYQTVISCFISYSSVPWLESFVHTIIVFVTELSKLSKYSVILHLLLLLTTRLSARDCSYFGTLVRRESNGSKQGTRMWILKVPSWLTRASKNQQIKTVKCRNVCKQELSLDQLKGSGSQGRDWKNVYNRNYIIWCTLEQTKRGPKIIKFNN